MQTLRHAAPRAIGWYSGWPALEANRDLLCRATAGSSAYPPLVPGFCQFSATLKPSALPAISAWLPWAADLASQAVQCLRLSVEPAVLSTREGRE
jgi:hypothetical protein